MKKFKVKYAYEAVMEVDEGHSDESDENNARYQTEDDIYGNIGAGYSGRNAKWEITEIK